MIWLKVSITRLWDHNLLIVDAKADAIARPNLTNAGERSAQPRGRREGRLIIIAGSDRARQCARAP
jgi:hypothetical protein